MWRLISNNVNIRLPLLIITAILNKWCAKRKRKERKEYQIINQTELLTEKSTEWILFDTVIQSHAFKHDCIFSSIHIHLFKKSSISRDITLAPCSALPGFTYAKTAPQLGKVSRCLFNSGVFSDVQTLFSLSLMSRFHCSGLNRGWYCWIWSIKQLTFKFSFISSSSSSSLFYFLSWFDLFYNLF